MLPPPPLDTLQQRSEFVLLLLPELCLFLTEVGQPAVIHLAPLLLLQLVGNLLNLHRFSVLLLLRQHVLAFSPL